MTPEDLPLWATEVFGERAMVRAYAAPCQVDVLVHDNTNDTRDKGFITLARWDAIIASGIGDSWEAACADAERYYIEREQQTAVKRLGLPSPRFRFVSQEEADAIRAFMALEGVPADTRPAQVVLSGTWTLEVEEPEPDK